MSRRSGGFRAALPAVAMAAMAILLVSACSASGSAPQGSPPINFGTQASTTPGVTGATAAAPTATPAAVAASTINITNFAFAPPTLTVPMGKTVTWTNHDEEPHTVVANDSSFHSPGMDTNATYSYTFAAAGTFDYICSIHPFMHGTVVVTK